MPVMRNSPIKWCGTMKLRMNVIRKMHPEL